jgi:hypothetical protein
MTFLRPAIKDVNAVCQTVGASEMGNYAESGE